jgi:hypothetical protein
MSCVQVGHRTRYMVVVHTKISVPCANTLMTLQNKRALLEYPTFQDYSFCEPEALIEPEKLWHNILSTAVHYVS